VRINSPDAFSPTNHTTFFLQIYLDVLENNLQPVIARYFADNEYVFQGDIVGCPTKDFCEFALTELHTSV
jgi:hypothetical protein